MDELIFDSVSFDLFPAFVAGSALEPATVIVDVGDIVYHGCRAVYVASSHVISSPHNFGESINFHNAFISSQHNFIIYIGK